MNIETPYMEKYRQEQNAAKQARRVALAIVTGAFLAGIFTAILFRL